MTSTGIRNLKNNLSRYVRRVTAGERIAVTDHGRIVAELVPPATAVTGRRGGRPGYEELLMAGIVRAPVEDGDPLAGWPTIKLRPGTAAALIDEDRGEQ